MSERAPCYWVVKNAEGKYLTPSGTGFAARFHALRLTSRTWALQEAANSGGRAVPVYVRVTPTRRGHSILWAIRRALAGQPVRRAFWIKGFRLSWEGGRFQFSDGAGNLSHYLSEESLSAQDWELAE